MNEADKYKNSSMVLYPAFEMRNLIELISYDLLVMSVDENERKDIEEKAKGMKGIKKSNEDYKSLKNRYQTFSAAIAEVAGIPIKAFDYKQAEKYEQDLGECIHTYTLSGTDIDYNNEFIINSKEVILSAIQFIKDYFVRTGKDNVFGILNFSTLTGDYKKEFDNWKNGVSTDEKDLVIRLKELNKKEPLNFTKK